MKQRDYQEGGAIPVIDQGQEFVGGYTDDQQMAYDGELPVVLFGDHTRSVKFVDQAFAVGADGIKIFRPAEGLLPKYFYYWMKSARLPDRGYGRHYQFLRKLSVPVPHPDEQRRIVAELETQLTRLDASVTALKRAQANLKRYRASVLKAACEGRLVPTEAELARQEGRSYESADVLMARVLDARRKEWKGPGKYSEPSAPNADLMGRLPPGWVWVTPDQLAVVDSNGICAGPFGTIFKAKDFRSSGIPIIFLRHVAPGRYLTHKPGFMDVGKWEELFQPYSVFGGELLITKLGEPPGVCAIYPDGIGPAMVTPDVIKLSVNYAAASPLFLLHYFNGEAARQFATGAAFGTTRLRLTIPLFREMPVSLPPLAEQHRIAAEVERRLSVIEELEATIVASLKRAERLRQSVLSKQFSQ